MWSLPLPLLLLLLTSSSAWAFSCDGSCSGHGACDAATGRCQCFPGYVGVSCKGMACPKDVAWVDYATATDTAHAMAECSNMGSCDRTTGQCKCVTGFEGAACERMSCPSCSNGRCVSMREAAAIQDNTNFFVATTYTAWDADKIFGCQCDNGFSGWDCSRRDCPKGDDPMTTAATADEVQHLNCECDDCTGSFTLTFRRRTTRNLLKTETATSLKAALEALDTITRVTVTISNSGTTICDANGATTSITFTHDPGNLPSLQLQSRLVAGPSAVAPVITISAGGALASYDGMAASIDGTREEAYCSNRGICDFAVGVCTCAIGFSSSDGAGAIGNKGDCGVGVASACPTTSNGPCDGKGVCSGTPSFICSCFTGFYGADCTLRRCPQGRAWFDEATAPDTAHAMAECSNRGTCDTKSGVCACHSAFTGSACEQLKCPTGGLGGAVCSGHGVCRTMQQLATLATKADGDSLGITYGDTMGVASTWDFDKIHGCHCADGYYMGPYADAFGEFRDFDCSSRFCPVGADPYETGKVNEIQTLSCQADGGSFTLKFRQQTTQPIAFNAGAAALKAALEALSTVFSVTTTIAGGGATVCAAAAVATTIEFTYEQGDLPMLSASSALTLTSSTATISVTETQKGTKANIECSSRGLCDRSTGVCKCFNYFLSSDGNGNIGTRGDCGYLASYPTIAIA